MKFVIDNGSQYITSNYYPKGKDQAGDENNIFDPKKLKWRNLKLK